MQRRSAVRADIMQALDGASAVAVQHHLLPQNLHTHWLLLDLLRDPCTGQSRFIQPLMQRRLNPCYCIIVTGPTITLLEALNKG